MAEGQRKGPGFADNPHFKTRDELEVQVDNYFARCENQKTQPTVSGLCLTLGVTREQFLGYSDRWYYFLEIRRAKLRFQEYLEARLIDDPKSSSGIIFLLKTQFGWNDRYAPKKTDHAVGVTLTEFKDDS